MKIGVLALQGAVSEHIKAIEACGAEGIAIKRPQQLKDIDGLIIPGGESTTIGRLMNVYEFIDAIRQFSAAGKPIFGTCAGLIVLAKRIAGQDDSYLGLMDITVSRNAFGRQRESFEADLDVKGIEGGALRGVFIRAPLVTETGTGVKVLATYQDQAVAVREGHLLGTSFHPELTDDYRMHEYFAEMVKHNR
ncbi:pyridoxal 5'-phosphate synthase subunit PdxT [Insulibacter thermoxylanivorax]|uniref:Pyridoxal 5'-phosphate synthase subunit PdxT n=1 Tax=Insulibacter thermoxylanivorax TaxID=2749268 RepID=A0A916QDE8_9BACL|nr:pyridoxal 5'-phosphate synthase glutaminase subunit PdxT [Insulibacter thermoxylanivorax]GFR38672.1 pyridoxal 5'-phosphate synthase subunit PdxT [Insulibacter thermoxylanivorax]